jgi:hypothetical protein
MLGWIAGFPGLACGPSQAPDAKLLLQVPRKLVLLRLLSSPALQHACCFQSCAHYL